jgi:glycosyltransferase involved in cell wall biosynthesis
MKLLYLENIANVSYNLAKKLREKGYDVTLLTRYNPKAGKLDLASMSQEPWVKLFRCESFFDKTFRYLTKILAEKVDIIHCHYNLEQGAYSIISRTLRKSKRVICHFHGTDMREISHTKKYGWIVRFNLKMADKSFVSTPDLLIEGVEFLPNPIDTESFKPMSPSIDLKRGHDFSLFCPSRVVWKFKGQNIFLYALKELKKRGYDCNLTLIEYGPDLENTKKLVDLLGLRENVSFVPPIHPIDMPKYYNSCDVVWAQLGLGHLGLVTLEALACNKPTLVDFIYEEAYPEYPPIIKVSNLQDIVKKTEELFTSKDFNPITRPWVLKYHTFEAVLKKLIETYNELFSPK